MPPAEREVDQSLVVALLGALPDSLDHLRGLTPVFVAEGWDNSIWRVGPELAARVPRRALAATLIEHEARWLPEAAAPLAASGVVVPAPVHLSPAGPRHPYPWLLVTWVPGTLLSELEPADRDPLARRLVDALPRLHRPAPPAAPHNPFRAPALRALPPPRPDVVGAARSVLGSDAVDGLLAAHHEAVSAPPWLGPPLWVHGDLHPLNLVRTPTGGLGLLDFGDVTAGDPAVDLGVLWTAFDRDQREVCVDRLAPHYDDHVWVRARGWAARVVLGIAGNDPSRFDGVLRHAVAQVV